MGEEMQQGEDVKAVALVLDRMDSIFDTMVLRCAVQLDLFDIIHRLSHQNDSKGKGVTVSEIAHALSSHPINTDHLGRVLRYVAHMGLLSKHKHNGEQERYGLTRASELYLLDSDINGEKNTTSLRASVSLPADDYFMSTWHGLSTVLLKQNNLFGMKHGGLFDGMVQRPELVSLFNRAMAEETRLLMPVVLRILIGVLGEARSLVDVGGGTGTAAANVAKAFPNVRCAVLDLPHVVQDADPGLAGVVEFIGGDMFERVPSSDVVLLMRILHDWEDEDCLKILKRCKEAIPKDGGRVIIVELIMDDNEDNMFDKYKLRKDLSMMFIGGKERSRDEWNSLLHDAGFYVHKITPATIGKSVIEACPIK